MKEVNPLSISQIKIELSRINFDRNAVSTLSYLLQESINLLTPYSNSIKNKDAIPDLHFLFNSLLEINTYREEQQRTIFDQIVEAFQEILTNFP
jgi:hypothetical protein